MDAIGVDPFDVDLDKLEEHARLEEREPVSRFPFKSPCWASWAIDFAVHVVLARMVEEKYPQIAKRLRNTSPRWGWRARAGFKRDVPLRRARA
jgi:hypothetical protein